jgi:hypothetical protein
MALKQKFEKYLGGNDLRQFLKHFSSIIGV